MFLPEVHLHFLRDVHPLFPESRVLKNSSPGVSGLHLSQSRLCGSEVSEVPQMLPLCLSYIVSHFGLKNGLKLICDFFHLKVTGVPAVHEGS